MASYHPPTLAFLSCVMISVLCFDFCNVVYTLKARCALHAASATRDFSRQFCVGDDMQIR